jgi:hypothetical protein
MYCIFSIVFPVLIYSARLANVNIVSVRETFFRFGAADGVILFTPLFSVEAALWWAAGCMQRRKVVRKLRLSSSERENKNGFS